MLITIIDSGIDPELKKENLIREEKTFTMNDSGEVRITDGAVDTIGHGTAVLGLIRSHLSPNSENTEYIVIKVMDIDLPYTDESVLIAALDWLFTQNIQSDIINISLGCSMISEYDRMLDACQRLTHSGSIIVSAFDNNGSVSFPAGMDCVIGVTSEETITTRNDFRILNSTTVNICAFGGPQRVSWLNRQTVIGGGDSFACAHVTGLLANGSLKAEEIIHQNVPSSGTFLSRLMHLPKSSKAAVFPFSKEMHALFRYPDLTVFDSVSVFDVPRSGRVGATVSHLLGISCPDTKIRNIAEISPKDYDILVIGHTRLLTAIYGWNRTPELIRSFLEAGKQVYSFDDLDIFFPGIFSPTELSSVITPGAEFDCSGLPPFGKLYRNSKPTVTVMGTGPQQGKFTLQLELRRRLLKDGYRVGQIGTEPTSFLFGFDYCIPFGNDSTLKLSSTDFIRQVNRFAFELCIGDSDIILSGSQSGTVTADFGNVYNYPINQTLFLMALNPDAVILCINPYDPPAEVSRTVHYIESACESRVIGVCLFPIDRADPDLGIYSRTEHISPERTAQVKSEIETTLGIPVFLLDRQGDIDKLYSTVIDFFADGTERII
ncbi:MAG: DUF1611 domain-containing protein [Ruminococcaceae bacterium]|nr:DUF1611 domain-containing protein [Oscillospiraceae bacterium]